MPTALTAAFLLVGIVAVATIAAIGPRLTEQAKRNAERDREAEMEAIRMQATGWMLVAHNRRMAALDRQQIPGGIHADHCGRCGRTMAVPHDFDSEPQCAVCDADQTDF